MADTTNNIHDQYHRPSDDEPDPLGLIGQIIAEKYRIDSFIGEGGFGKVYTGTNINLVHQKVVVKFFTQAKIQDRFDQEAEIICKLAHPGICSLIDYLADERALVIPYIDGTDLHQHLKLQGPLSAIQFLRVGREILDAIEFAHSKSIAHRDIKPSNIMIGKNNSVYLIDFGIAKEIKENSTRTTTFMGTPDFAAPERHQKNPSYNPFLSDIFELGVTLFYLATKTHLYQDRDHPDPNDWNLPNTNKLSSRLKRVLRKATQPLPPDRYQSIAEMSTDFHRIKQPYRKGTAVLRAMMVSGLVVVALAVADILNQQYDITSLPGLIPWRSEVPMENNPIDSMSLPSDNMLSGDSLTGIEMAVNEDTITTDPPPIEAIPVAVATPEPITPMMRVNVLPAGLIHLEVDGLVREFNQLFEISPGQHEIVIEHEDFPVYNTIASVSADTADLTFDLRERFPKPDSTKLILILLPRDDGYGFSITCNRKKFQFDKPREFSFYLRNGLWNVSAEVKSLVLSEMKELDVDSIVVGVVGKSQTEVIPGNQGYLNVNSGPAGDQIMRLLIHWSDVL